MRERARACHTPAAQRRQLARYSSTRDGYCATAACSGSVEKAWLPQRTLKYSLSLFQLCPITCSTLSSSSCRGTSNCTGAIWGGGGKEEGVGEPDEMEITEGALDDERVRARPPTDGGSDCNDNYDGGS